MGLIYGFPCLIHLISLCAPTIYVYCKRPYNKLSVEECDGHLSDYVACQFGDMMDTAVSRYKA